MNKKFLTISLVTFFFPFAAFAMITQNLSMRQSGSEVRELQAILHQAGFFNGEITGYFGIKTKNAVIAFQKSHGITPPRGYVGPLTRSELLRHMSTATPVSMDQHQDSILINPNPTPAPISVATNTGQTGTTSHSSMSMGIGQSPQIDRSLIPAPREGFSGPRVRTTWYNPNAWYDPQTGLANPSCIGWNKNCAQGMPNPSCAKEGPTCHRPPSETPNGPFPNDIGAFRVTCDFAKMTNDDPIVFPSQSGASHLHTFFGNTAVDAYTTAATITLGNSTCAGGTLNRTAYWVPSMIDTGNNKPLIPKTNNVYYKCSYGLPLSIACDQMQPVPIGLKMLAGNPKNTNLSSVGARYLCLGPKGENPGWKKTITDAYNDGTCTVGGDFIMEVPFPPCWDGVNLDSKDHTSHMSQSEQYQKNDGSWSTRCPATHPVVIPSISYNIHYEITDNTAVSRWRLSSDMDTSLPAGITGHGDYLMGWDKKTMETFINNCDRAHTDCHDYLLGDGTTLF